MAILRAPLPCQFGNVIARAHDHECAQQVCSRTSPASRKASWGNVNPHAFVATTRARTVLACLPGQQPSLVIVIEPSRSVLDHWACRDCDGQRRLIVAAALTASKQQRLAA
jgi:hypothetical protein